jgi:alpha-1,6-mannosyltransferase
MGPKVSIPTCGLYGALVSVCCSRWAGNIGVTKGGKLRSTHRDVALIGAAIVLLTFIGPTVHRRFDSNVFFVLTITCGAGAALAYRLNTRTANDQSLWTVLLVAAVMRLGMVWVDNYLSSDIYRYVWDGRVQAAGINPYRYVPAAPELTFLRDVSIFPHINRRDYAVTIYPPAAQIIFFLVTRLGESVIIMKVVLLIFDAVTIASLIAILRLLGKPPSCVVAYAWHPLPVWEIAVNGHIDAVMVAILTVSLWAALRGRNLLACVLASIGALVKPTALLALPVFWKPWSWRLPLAAVTTILVLYLPYISVGWGVLGFLSGYAREEGITTGDGFWLVSVLQHITGPLTAGHWLYLSACGIFLAALFLRAGFRADRAPQVTISVLAQMVFAFLFLLSPIYPWYFLALVPFLALTPTLGLWILATGAFILYDVIDYDTVPHMATRKDILYSATLIAAAYDLWCARLKDTAHISRVLRS